MNVSRGFSISPMIMVDGISRLISSRPLLRASISVFSLSFRVVRNVAQEVGPQPLLLVFGPAIAGDRKHVCTGLNDPSCIASLVYRRRL